MNIPEQCIMAQRTFTTSILLALAAASLSAQDTLVPLTDLLSGTYQGHLGGLYPGGVNTMPPAHRAAGFAGLSRIRPRDSSGAFDSVNGKIVVLSIGMSHCTHEFSVFKTLADVDTLKNPSVILVDGAKEGQTASIIAQD